MTTGKEKRPAWFKMFRNQKALIDSVPDAEVGRALKAIFQYFENGEIPEMTPLEFAVFSSVKPYVDASFEDYHRSVDTGRAGGQKRWGKETAKDDRPPIGPLCHPIGVSTEAEAEVEAEVNKGNNEIKGDKGIFPVSGKIPPPF